MTETINQQLNKLFCKWKEEHENEDAASLAKTKNAAIAANSFCVDGPICEDCTEVDVLYILKESNLAENLIEDKDEFWLRKIMCCPKKLGRKRLPRRLKKAQEQRFLSSVKKMAYMNINKRGGGHTTEPKKLEAYGEHYQALIAKEIDIINPRKIVCCDASKTILQMILSLPNAENYEIYSAYHPSYSGKKNSFTDQCFIDSITLAE